MTAIQDISDAIADGAVRPDVPEKWRLGRYFVPKSRYVDPEFLQLEIERVFPRTWMPACRAEEIPQVGDYVEFDVIGESILVVRETEHRIRAFFNACRHRGTRLARGRGRVGNLRCPFHAWQYALDGTNVYVHDQDDFAQLTPEYLCLRQCQVGEWGGWVFVNPDNSAEPLAQYLAPMPDRLAILNIDAMRYRWHKTFIMPCNWKTALEAFSESYHLPGTHPQLGRPGDRDLRPASRRELLDYGTHAPSQVLGHHIGRYNVEARDPSKPRYPTKDALRAINEYHLGELRALRTPRDVQALEELIKIDSPDGPDLFPAFKSMLRELALAEGLDWADIPDDVRGYTEGSYTIFPNMIFLVRQGSLLGYRALPNGSDPDSCIFLAYAIDLYPAGKEPEFNPEFHDDWRDGDPGEVLSQDFSNVRDVTAGVHSSSFLGATLSPKQEKPVFHRQVIIDEYIFGPSPR